MAASQVAKKLRDKRQKETLEGIFKKVRQDKPYTLLSSFCAG
jgi:hypothetical protein